MVWDTISYLGRSNLLRIEDNLNGNRYVREVLQPEVVPFLPTHPTSPWSVYSPDMSPIPHVWYLVGRRLVRDLRPAASKDEFLMRMQAIWDSLPQANIQNLFDSMLRHIAALTAALSGNTKY
ncbi:transposable element Tcb2 transposase [Trichonephila clavipes]|nr:transposable element Tcb2 transposase [Trichonephila clavipes]